MTHNTAATPLLGELRVAMDRFRGELRYQAHATV